MKKQIFSFIISAVLAISVPISVYSANFNDTKGHWAENTINRLADMGIVNGVSASEFNPNGIVTRAEYLKMMMNLAKIETVPARNGECLEVKTDEWYADYLQSALDKALIPKEMIASYKVNLSTDEEGTKVHYSGAFNGDLPIEREQMAVLTMHLHQYSLDADNVKNMSTSAITFTDIDNISVWAQPSVRLAVAYGFIEGMDDGSFQPRETATRAQAVTLLGRIIDNAN